MVDHVLDHYFQSTDWLTPFGQIIGIERHDHHQTKTLRVCLTDFQRFDLVFIAESLLQGPSSAGHTPFQPTDVVVWSRLLNLEAYIAECPSPAPYQAMSLADIERMVDTFWFKASVAIAKVVRNDWLIGLHLALDLARDCLVLQMIRRDQAKETSVHRIGGWGNEVVKRLPGSGHIQSSEDILNLVQESCALYDGLAAMLLPNYTPRSPLLMPSIVMAKSKSNNDGAVQTQPHKKAKP